MPKSEKDAFARSDAAARVYELLVRMAAKHVVRVGGVPFRPAPDAKAKKTPPASNT